MQFEVCYLRVDEGIVQLGMVDLTMPPQEGDELWVGEGPMGEQWAKNAKLSSHASMWRIARVIHNIGESTVTLMAIPRYDNGEEDKPW